MAWYDYLSPAYDVGAAYGAISGNKNPIPSFGEAYNWLAGDPNGVKAAYDQGMGMARQSGQDTSNFLQGRLGQAQQFYAPMQQMFGQMYGTGGIRAPQVPGVPGQRPGPMQAMFGGRR